MTGLDVPDPVEEVEEPEIEAVYKGHVRETTS